MARHKVAELEGALLDAAVAKAEGFLVSLVSEHGFKWSHSDGAARFGSPSRDWAIGGPIIERERITVQSWPKHWSALWYGPHGLAVGAVAEGATPLIAAMRAYVASKFGETVDLPAG